MSSKKVMLVICENTIITCNITCKCVTSKKKE